jgi:SAM-dependent methyltransferase
MPELYDQRFGDEDRRRKEAIWLEIGAFLQLRYIPRTSRVLDIAADRGYFIHSIEADERWASDVRDTSADMPDDVRFLQADGLALAEVAPTDYFDIVFMSNYLEHLGSSDAVVEQLRVAHALLRRGGRVIVLQPNIRLVGAPYWDFIDHRVPLTERSLIEAASLAGFSTQEVITRFLPYTTKGRLPARARLVRAYLRFPPAWRLLGKQTLYVGRRRG